MDIQGLGEQFLSDIRGDGKVYIASGFNFDLVYLVGMKDIFLKECSFEEMSPLMHFICSMHEQTKKHKQCDKGLYMYGS